MVDVMGMQRSMHKYNIEWQTQIEFLCLFMKPNDVRSLYVTKYIIKKRFNKALRKKKVQLLTLGMLNTPTKMSSLYTGRV